MKFRKIIAALAAAAVAVSAASVSSFAVSGNAIDFEDGDFSFIGMNTDTDGDDSILSVEEYDGSKQLKVDVQNHIDCTPKIRIDIDKLLSPADFVKIKTVECDMTVVPKNPEEAAGWVGGLVATGGADDHPAWHQSDFAIEENSYAPGDPVKGHLTKKMLIASQQYSEDTQNPYVVIMRFKGQEAPYYIYIDNVVFKDKDGNVIALGTANAAEAAPAAEEAPASDGDSAPAATGNTSAAAMLAVMAAAGVAAVISRKRK